MTTSISSSPIEAIPVFKQSWKLTFSKLFLPYLGCYLIVYTLPTVLMYTAGGMVTFHDFSKWPTALLAVLIASLIGLVLTPGWIYAALKIANQEDFTVSAILRPTPTILNAIGAMIIVGIITTIGFICLIVPGIYLGVRLQLTLFYVIGKQLGPIEAIKASWQATNGIWWQLFFFDLLFVIVNILSNLLGILKIPCHILATMAWTAGGARIFHLCTEPGQQEPQANTPEAQS